MKNLRTPEMTKNCDISNFQAFPIPDLQKVGFVEYHFFFWHLGRPRYIHTYIHAYIHTYMPSFYTPSFFVTHHLSHTTLYCTTQLFLLFDPSPPPSSFLPSPSRYNICCPLLEEVDIWGYLVRFFPTRS